MLLEFYFSGSVVFRGKSDCVPPVGAQVEFVMQSYKKGFPQGALVSAVVTDLPVPVYDFSNPDEPVVRLDVNDFMLIGDEAAEAPE